MKWDTFRFYTPTGTISDTNGHKYYDIPAGEIDITRDTVLDREIIVYTQAGSIHALGFFEGNVTEIPNFDNTGDILFIIKIPTNSITEIEINVKEVINDS